MTENCCKLRDMRTRLSVRSVTEARTPSGAVEETYSEDAVRFGTVERLRGSELEQARKISGEVSHKVIMRFYDVDNTHQLQFTDQHTSRTHSLGVLWVDQEQDGFTTTCYCREQV